jgi:phage FluMu gp28-like protein
MNKQVEFLPYQRAWIADQARVKVCEKSRRIGLTWCEAADRALSAASKSGMDTWYIGYNNDMALEFVETAAWWARQFDRVARRVEEIAVHDQSRDILAYRIRFASGRKIVALSSRPSNLRGKQGCAVIDEAAFHEDLQGLLKAALAFTMWGGCVRVISTHNGADSAFNELVSDIRAGWRPYSLHRITLEDAVAQGLYKKIAERLEREWSPEREAEWKRELEDFYGDNADEELHCIPRASAGAFLSSVLIEARMESGVPVIRWEMPAEFGERSEAVRRAETAAFLEDHLQRVLDALDPTLATCFGEDFGRLGDLTVIWPMQIASDLTRRTPFAVELRNIPFRQQEQILFYIVDRLPRFLGGAMDARGNGQYLAETARQRYGARIAQVMLSLEWYREQMPRFKAAFENGAITIPKDADILLDHRAIVVENGVAQVGDRRVRGSDNKSRHGDSAIAAALAYFASRQDFSEIDYRSASRLESVHRDPFGAPPEEDSITSKTMRGRFGAGAW